MPRRPKWLYQMPPEERAAYLAKQPQKIQVEIESLERERDRLARQVGVCLAGCLFSEKPITKTGKGNPT